MITVENYSEDLHYEAVASWYKKRMKFSIHKDIIPSLGIVAKINESMACGTWASMDNAKSVAFQLFTISNPYIFSPKEIEQSLQMANDALHHILRTLGYTVVFPLSSSHSLNRFYSNEGCELIERNISIYRKELF